MIYEFNPEQIVKGSGYISSQCRGSSEIELGMYEVSEVNRTVKCLELKKEVAFLKSGGILCKGNTGRQITMHIKQRC